VKRGLGRTFQINSLFRNLPVLDNVALAVAERRAWRHGCGAPQAASRHQERMHRAVDPLGLAGDA